MESQSFDGLVELYDESRDFDQACFDAALDYIVECFPPSEFGRLFEPGIGTGRIAIPFAERGYRVTGADISEEMMAVLRAKLADRPLDITLHKADVTDLPFPDGSFDLAVAVYLFYHIPEWRKAADEILRVIRPGGTFIMMHTGMGSEVPGINQRYKELCAEKGYPTDMIGAKSTTDVVNYYQSIGCRMERIIDRWQWVTSIELGKALEYVRRRAYAFMAFTPDDIHAAVMKELESEMLDRFGSLSAVIEVPNQIGLVLVQTDHCSPFTRASRAP